MLNVKAKVKNYPQFKKDLKKDEDRTYKAAMDAARIVGYWLKNRLQKEIIEGAPGGQPFRQLSYVSKISRRWESLYGSQLWGRTNIPHSPDSPLRALAIPIRYEAQQFPDKMRVRVGVTKFKGVSGSWRKIFYKQQEGFSMVVERREHFRKMQYETIRQYFYRIPPEIGEEKIAFKKLYLHVPPRKIIDPFWRKYQKPAYQKIKESFEAKMAGKRV